ncbi:Biosynthetic Aromatic amino acid aminotransferase beta [hydrothermal vent metagenome]|uniref:Biosynthetic Aromatic amino acid aminotransferase beta n=1 Tax=hydrothermal vent metagenome TaxID=652676 RepID=A0A3B0ZJH4_9ZZZZ
MTNIFQKLCVQGVAGLQPYKPGKPLSELAREFGITDAVKIASNENPLGVCAKVKQFLVENIDDLNRYPDGNGYDLKSALAKHYQMDFNQFTLGNGSNDVLELIARAFVSQYDEVIFSEHAFAVYPLVTQAIGATAVVTKATNWGNDLSNILNAITEKTKLIFIANPNNPTGTWLAEQDLSQFLEKVPDNIIVVLDEAYFEYASHVDMAIKNYPDGLQWLSKHLNLVVTRTFSKAYALAGLRVGYAMSHPDFANILNRVRQPFNVNTMALKAAEIALTDTQHLQNTIKLNVSGMAYIVSELNKMKLHYIPSAGNFISVSLGASASKIYERLLKFGIIVRSVDNYSMSGYLRFSIGNADENQRAMLGLFNSIEK